MKRYVVPVFAAAFIFCSSYCLADSAIPNLVGTWSVMSEGGALIKGDKPDEKSHWVAEQKTLTAEAKITEQNGRVLKGEFTSSKATEKFVAIIGPDNKSVYYADENGILDLKIVNRNTLLGVYRQITAKDVVIALGTWKRKK
jgi:hypothetical protein